MNIKRTLKYGISGCLLGGSILLVSCSGGGSVTSNSSPVTPSTGDVEGLQMVGPNLFPAVASGTIPVVFTNTTATTVNNLYYTVVDNTTDADIVINEASAQQCKVIPAGDSCTIQATIPTVSRPGSFAISATQESTQSAKVTLAGRTKITSPTIGVVATPTNTSSGADGITFYYPENIIANESGVTQMIVTAYVASASAGSFNSINLTDGSGKPLSNYTVLSGNSGQGMTNLAQGSIVTFLVTIDNNTQFQFKGQTALNEKVVSEATNSNTSSVYPTGTKVGILNILPNYFNLTENNESQTITLANSGNADVSSLNITPQSPLIMVSNTCGSTLAANANCNYTVKFDSKSSPSGTTGIIFSYNNGSKTQEPTATVNYKGSGSTPVGDVGLEITDSSGNFDFKTRTKTPTQTDLITLTNAGGIAISQFNYSNYPKYFNITTSNLDKPCTVNTTLEPGQSCNINLIYSNETVTPSTTAAVTVGYSYTLAGATKTGSSTVDLTYQTEQSQAILNMTLESSFANIVNNGVDTSSNVVRITNDGDETATGISAEISPAGSLFSLINEQSSTICGISLAKEQSCTYSIGFGPASSPITAGTKEATLLINYTPSNTSGGTSSVVKANVALSGNVVAAQGANISQTGPEISGFAGGDGTSSNTAYQVEQGNTTHPTITYTIKNSGSVAANNFYLDNSSDVSSDVAVPEGSSVVVTTGSWTRGGTCGTSSSKITLGASESCVVTFTLNTSVIGAKNLDLSQVSMNWVDQDSPRGESQNMSGTVYANVYAPATIAVITNPASNISIKAGESFTMTATLSGGYQLAAQTINATTTNQNLSFINNNCAISTQTAACTITAQATSGAAIASAQTVRLDNKTTPAMMPTPSSVAFAIAPSGKLIFVTRAVYTGNLDGLDGANDKCQAAANSGSVTKTLGAIWKALINGNNATESGLQYFRTDNLALDTATSTNWLAPNGPTNSRFISYDESGVSMFGYDSAWTGSDASHTCSGWTNGSNVLDASVGAVYPPVFYPDVASRWWSFGDSASWCNTPRHLYCVQQ